VDIPVRQMRLVDVEPDEVPMTLAEMQEFFRVWMEDPNSFRSVKLQEYFDRDPVELLLGETYPLKTKIKLTPNHTFLRERPRRDKLEDHDAVVLYEWLKTAYANPENVPDIPRDNLSDDEFILDDLYLNRAKLFLVSDDKRLAQALSTARRRNGRHYRTYRIPCHLWAKGKWSWREFGPPMTDLNVEVDMGSVQAYFANLAIDEETAKKAYEAIGQGSSILRKKGMDVRTLRIPDLKPSDKYISPYQEVVFGEDEEIVFPPKGFPYRFEVIPFV